MLKIPESQRSTVQHLLSLSPEKLGRLIDLVASASPSASFRSLARQIEKKAKDDRFVGLNGILQTVAALSDICVDDEIPFADMADQLVSAARELRGDVIGPPDGNWDRLKGDIARLLKSSAAGVLITFKASELVSEHEHVYCAGNSRIISDVRAIFPSGELSAPVGAVVVHMLKLAYHQGDALNEFYVALDAEDLRLLRDLLDRAIAKEEKLKEAIGPSIAYIAGVEEPA